MFSCLDGTSVPVPQAASSNPVVSFSLLSNNRPLSAPTLVPVVSLRTEQDFCAQVHQDVKPLFILHPAHLDATFYVVVAVVVYATVAEG